VLGERHVAMAELVIQTLLALSPRVTPLHIKRVSWGSALAFIPSDSLSAMRVEVVCKFSTGLLNIAKIDVNSVARPLRVRVADRTLV
jgi:hypothetical protein